VDVVKALEEFLREGLKDTRGRRNLRKEGEEFAITRRPTFVRAGARE
jgi:hypothetical protein